MAIGGEKKERIFLGFGSNLGRRKAQIRQALRHLERSGIRVRALSSFYLTEPLGCTDQPWFINAAAEIETPQSPEALLALCQEVEQRLKRRRNRLGRPRTIDIDILLFGQRIISEKALTIPHPRLPERRFVLIPLAEIAPAVIHPVEKATMTELLNTLACDKKVLPCGPEDDG